MAAPTLSASTFVIGLKDLSVIQVQLEKFDDDATSSDTHLKQRAKPARPSMLLLSRATYSNSIPKPLEE
jgi:hypothetical protein